MLIFILNVVKIIIRQCFCIHLLAIVTVGQGHIVLAVGAGGGCFDIFTLVCPFSPLSPSL